MSAPYWLIPLGFIVALAACGGVLPSKRSTTPSVWQDFDQAKSSFDQVVPGQTTVGELVLIGFDPLHTPNMRRLNYVEVMEVFMPHPSIQRTDLDPTLQACIEAREGCYAYEIKPGVTHEKRHGNAALDVLGFQRLTTTTGWQFTALIVVNNDTVAYKLWGGEPNVQREESQKTPLGPLQGAGKVLADRLQ